MNIIGRDVEKNYTHRLIDTFVNLNRELVDKYIDGTIAWKQVDKRRVD